VNRWRVVFTRQARKDARRLAEALLEILREDPYRSPPRFEKFVGDLAGAYSRRITLQHRLVYQVLKAEHTVKVLRMWTRWGERCMPDGE